MHKIRILFTDGTEIIVRSVKEFTEYSAREERIPDTQEVLIKYSGIGVFPVSKLRGIVNDGFEDDPVKQGPPPATSTHEVQF